MGRLSGIFFIAILMALLTGNVFAQEMMEKTDEEQDVRYPMMAPGMQGMVGTPMMQQTTVGQRMMGGLGTMGIGQMPMMEAGMMMGGGMMCPVCGSMMPMMQHMMGGPGMMGMGQMPMMGAGMMMGGVGMMSYMADLAGKLGLSEEQRDEIKGIFTSHRKDMIRKNADRQIAEVDLYELTQEEEPGLDAIEEHIREIANLEAQIRYSQIKVWIDAKSVLTEEQTATLRKLLKEKQAQMVGVKKTKAGEPGPAEHHR